MTTPRKLFIKTYGCQMNVYDSERMAEALGASGYVGTDRAEDADMILLNTCHIREKAAEKVYSELGRLKPLKVARPDLKIGIAGCVAQAEGEEIMRQARGDGVPDGAGRMRQVLRVLRCALYAWRRSQPPRRPPAVRSARPGGARGARDHAAGAECERVSWRGTGRAQLDACAAGAGTGRDRRLVAHSLHHQPPQ